MRTVFLRFARRWMTSTTGFLETSTEPAIGCTIILVFVPIKGDYNLANCFISQSTTRGGLSPKSEAVIFLKGLLKATCIEVLKCSLNPRGDQTPRRQVDCFLFSKTGCNRRTAHTFCWSCTKWIQCSYFFLWKLTVRINTS